MNLTCRWKTTCKNRARLIVDNNGFVRYLNKAAAARPAKGKREVGVNIQHCHARPESLETIGRILKDFRSGRKEPHYYINKEGNKSIEFLNFSHFRSLLILDHLKFF
jgi:hypothetical protein